ncbi:S-layer homology domain-containing protein [Pontibacillus marinus]|uniref:SLH domain-containing protein n=1 Tax=Pontibacillus marinus BH030004 = DSM 16465 TaxID=1385511 RepID=A0A0A5GDG6_9BACI|nr:S-layer homology domain-containing protein [Pontibacillus marinus]KGX91266.1 hypothetical protein N783_11160 [Pontibacillus marinus BH030004 = DSM 16465]
MKEKNLKPKLNSILATSLATSAVVSIPTGTVMAAENDYQDVQDLVDRLDGVYDNLSTEDGQALRNARDAFVNASDSTWTEIHAQITDNPLTEEEFKNFTTDLSEILYASNTNQLKTAIDTFLTEYDAEWFNTKLGVSVTSAEMLNLIATVETEALNLLQSSNNSYKSMLEAVFAGGEIDDTTMTLLLNAAYDKALTKLQDESFKYHDAYEQVNNKISLDKDGLIGVLTGLKNNSSISSNTIIEGQKSLIRAALAEVDNTAPVKPTVNAIDSNDTSISGTADKYSEIFIVDQNTGSVIHANPTYADANGNYSVTIPSQSAGTVLEVKAVDAAGNESAVETVTVTQASTGGNTGGNTGGGTPSGGDNGGSDDEPDNTEDEDGTEDSEEDTGDVDLDVDPADGEVIVDNDAVTVTKEKNEEGKTVVKVELNADEVAKGLEDKEPEQVKSIRVQIEKDNAEDIGEVSIPSNALNAVKEKNENAIVEVATDGASYKLPVNEVNTDELAKEFSEQLKEELGDEAAELTSDDVEISVQVNEVPEDDEQVVENVTQNNLRPVSKVIEFKVEARTKDGSKKKEIKRFKKYVEREIEGDQEFDMTHSTAVRLNDDGTFTAVPTLFDGTKATVKSMSNSKYTIVENDKTFSDIEDTWNQETIEKLASKYIIQGKLDGTYAPKDHIKRSEFTTLISRALGLVDEEVDFEGMFPDVKEGKWYANHVEAAVDAGIIQGREDGTFDPDSYVTRNETAAMIKRAMDFVSYDKSELNQDKEVTKYEDYDQIAKWSRDNVELLLQAEIMSGRGNGNFDPYGDINRAEMAKVLDEFLSFVKLING